MRIVIECWPTVAKQEKEAMMEWLRGRHPGAAILDGDEDFEPFPYAGLIIVVETKDTRTEEDIKRGAV